MGALAPLVRVALDQPESGPLGPRPGDFHSPLVELCRCVKTNPFWVSYRFLTGFLEPPDRSSAVVRDRLPSSPGAVITTLVLLGQMLELRARMNLRATPPRS